jgi:hypothetical protein
MIIVNTKKMIFTLVITMMTIQTYSQNPNELRIYYGFSDTELKRDELLVGSGSADVENSKEFGIKFLKQLKNNLSIEFGVNFIKSDLTLHGAPMIPEIPTRYEKLEMISIPIYANYILWKYLFVNGGPILDFQTSENSIDSQSGVGYSIGFGGKYNFNNFLIYVNPNYKRHAVLPFEKENYSQKLTEFGIQFGLGYKF